MPFFMYTLSNFGYCTRLQCSKGSKETNNHLQEEAGSLKQEPSCHRLNVCVSPKFICRNLIPNAVVLGDGPWGDV